jgi:hypothetical protein
MKLLVCVFPWEEFTVGDTLKVADAEAEVRLLLKNGRYHVWEMQKDLGPDAAPAPQAPAAPAPEPVAELPKEEPIEVPAQEEPAEEAALEEPADEVVAPRRGRKASR